MRPHTEINLQNDALIAELYQRFTRMEAELEQLKNKTLAEAHVVRKPSEAKLASHDTVEQTRGSAPTPVRIGWQRREVPNHITPEQELASLIVRQSHEALVGVDAAGLVLVWNPAAEHLFGWKANEVLGKPIPFVPEHYRDEHLGLMVYPASVCFGNDLATQRQHKDGTLVPVRLNVLEGPRGSMVFRLRRSQTSCDSQQVMDLGPAKGPDSNVKTMAEKLQFISTQVSDSTDLQAYVALGRAAAGVAHDLNNLLTVLQGYGELMSEQAPPAIAAIAADIAYAAEQGGMVCRNLLSVLRPEYGLPPQTNLYQMLRRTERIWRTILGSHIGWNMTLRWEHAIARIHPGDLFQIVLNLICNAADAMPHGGTLKFILDRILMLQGPEPELPPGYYLVLQVADTGSGIAPELLAQLGQTRHTTRPEHYGLGLLTIQQLLAKHRGSLKIESQLSQGTTVTVYLREL